MLKWLLKSKFYFIFSKKNKLFKFFLKVLDLYYEDENSNELIAMEDLGDRILRSVISPCGKCIAIGLAGIRAHPNNSVCPLRIYDFEK